MPLTRTHIAFLGIISIFTGIIGPGVRSAGEMLSYLMTDIRAIAYAILIALILAFFLAALRKWKLYRMCGVLIIFGIISLALITFILPLESIKSGGVVSGVSWAWVFLIIGAILLGISYRTVDIPVEESSFSDAIDTVIGMVGGFALACIAGILILSSLSFFGRGQNHNILETLYTSGELRALSGGMSISTRSYGNMPHILYDRGSHTLLTIAESGSTKIWDLISGDSHSSGSIEKNLSPLLLGNTLYMRDNAGYAYSGGTLILGSHISQGDDAIVYKNNTNLVVIHENGMTTMPSGGGIISRPIILSADKKTLIYPEIKNGDMSIIKNSSPLGGNYDTVDSLSLSTNGESSIGLVQSGSERFIIKNNLSPLLLPEETISGSFMGNGSHFLFITEKDSIKRVSHDMLTISRDLQEVRETFLEKEGGSYAYFGRPLGEKHYCLFTRYKGNLCGLEAYMNPILGADGGSIIFAGKKDGIWSIYRNTDVIIKDTGYTGEMIDYDYAFYDATNPRAYLFIIYDASTRTYTYLKNGKILPGVWEDVSTEVYFGYDNHILTSAKDESGWHIIEL